MSLTDSKFNFDRLTWANMRPKIRVLGTASRWYKYLSGLAKFLEDRSETVSWIYKQRRLTQADATGLKLWRQRRGLKAITGETPEELRERLILDDAIRRDPANVALKRKRLVQYLGDVSIDQVAIESVFRSSEYREETFRVGSEIGRRVFSRRYVLFRYRIHLPELSESVDRSILDKRTGELNIGGNWPEFREDQGPADSFGTGAPLGSRLYSMNDYAPRRVAVF